MASLSRFDSHIVRFRKPPVPRSWPSPAGLRLFFEACVAELFELCRRDPTTWHTQADLAAMLYTILAQDLPAHGLAPRALHAGLELAAKPLDAARSRHPKVNVDLVLLHPDTLTVRTDDSWQGSLQLLAAVRRSYRDVPGLRRVLEDLLAVSLAHPQAPAHLVVMGLGHERDARDHVAQLALERGIPLLGELIEPPRNAQAQLPLL
jgi:hypothetical protein